MQQLEKALTGDVTSSSARAGRNPMNWKTADTVALSLILALTGLFAWRAVNFGVRPLEDAAMLMRYADNLAQGNGIVWNVGEPPVDGATDFLFLVFVALLRHIGLSFEAAVRLITLSSHFSTVALIYVGMRKVQRAGTVPALLSAAYFAVGPGLFIAAAYFGTPFFAFAVAIAWLLAQRLILSDDRSISGYLAFSVACLLAGLIRPEGVLISVLMLAGIGVIIPLKDLRRLAVVFGCIFLVFGGAYFIWRWNYFGYPLPNPFYKKGGGHLYLSGLKDSVENNLRLLYPFIPAFLLSTRRTNTFRLAVAFSVPIVGSVAMWVLLSGEMNFGGRFQYPTLAICVMSWFPLVRTLWNDLTLPKLASLTSMQRLAVIATAIFVLGGVLTEQVINSRSITYGRDGRYDVARILSQYAGRGYTIATTEAGLLPLYSKWRAIDTWGLNDQWIGHNGPITEQYLAQQRPDVIMWHGYFSPCDSLPPSLDGSLWDRQVRTLRDYAEHHNYTLAAAFGISPEDTHYYYVRTELPEREEIVQQIRSLDYGWYENGRKSLNYAELCSNQHTTNVQHYSAADVDETIR
jgi:hypothetical protein